MASVNKVMLLGNLTRDPELRYTPQGAGVCEFALALNRTYTNKQTGQRVEEVSFIDVEAWGRTAELCAEYLKKGRSVYVEGRLKTRKWQDKDGVEKYTTEVIAEQMQLLGGREGAGGGSSDDRDDYGGGGGQRPAPAARPAAQSRPAASKPATGFDNMVDDIPF